MKPKLLIITDDMPMTADISRELHTQTSVVAIVEQQAHSSALALARGWPAEAAYPTAEEYFIDQDMFCGYVHNVVNIERLKQGLSCISDSHMRRCFDIISSRIYRQPVGKQANIRRSDTP